MAWMRRELRLQKARAVQKLAAYEGVWLREMPDRDSERLRGVRTQDNTRRALCTNLQRIHKLPTNGLSPSPSFMWMWWRLSRPWSKRLRPGSVERFACWVLAYTGIFGCRAWASQGLLGRCCMSQGLQRSSHADRKMWQDRPV